MNVIPELAAFPLVAEFVDELESEADEMVSRESLKAAVDLFDMAALSAAIERSRSADVPDCEGNVYDLICEGGGADLDLYKKVVYADVGYTYMDSFSSVLWNG